MQLLVNLKNIAQGWTDFPLTTKYTLASGSAIPGIVHKSASADSVAQISCVYDGKKVTLLSDAPVGAAAGVVALFVLIIK